MARGPITSLTSEELTDAAVAVVQERAALALRGEEEHPGLGSTPGSRHDGYIEAYAIASILTDRGLITHENIDAVRPYGEEARKSIEGKIKRLLDAEAAKSDARIRRFSSAKDKPPPKPDGYLRTYYGQSVLYTTPELVERGRQAVEARLARERTESEAMAALLREAEAAGLPKPIAGDASRVTYDLAGLRRILQRVSY